MFCAAHGVVLYVYFGSAAINVVAREVNSDCLAVKWRVNAWTEHHHLQCCIQRLQEGRAMVLGSGDVSRDG